MSVSLVPPEQMSNMFFLFRLPQVALHYAAQAFGECGSRTCEVDAYEGALVLAVCLAIGYPYFIFMVQMVGNGWRGKSCCGAIDPREIGSFVRCHPQLGQFLGEEVAQVSVVAEHIVVELVEPLCKDTKF